MSEMWDSIAVAAQRTEIRRLEEGLRKLTQELLTKQDRVKMLKLEMQAKCDHLWKAPIVGYEHEGRYCAHCDVNDMHLPMVIREWERAQAEAELAPQKVARPAKVHSLEDKAEEVASLYTENIFNR